MLSAVLLVDDEPRMARAWANRFKPHFPTVIVNDGAEAIRRIETAPWSGFCLDFLVPGRNGLEVLRYIRNAGCSAPAVLVSAYNLQAYDAEVSALNARILDKPMTAAQEARFIYDVVVAHPRAGGETEPSDHPLFHKWTAERRLTTQQMHVLSRSVNGLHSSDVCEELGIAKETFNSHARAICDKFGIKQFHLLVVHLLKGMVLSSPWPAG